MLLTFKVKHNIDFSKELKKAKQIAEFIIKQKDKCSSADVKQFGLHSALSNQIIRKYGRNKKIKKISNIKLTVPNQNIRLNKTEETIYIISLETTFKYQFKHDFDKVNQIEIDNNYFYVSVEVKEDDKINIQGWIGIDRNTNGHCAVAACTETNKVIMLGKKTKHVNNQYKNIRRQLQREKKYNKLKMTKKRDSNIVKDLNHKVSSKLVNYAKENKCGIKLEDLTGIRKTKKQAKSFKFTLNSWGYYQLQSFIEYKAKIAGVTVAYIDPAYTSQTCHKCGQLGTRNGKSFKCLHCGYTAHADVNASWNIANSEKYIIIEDKEGNKKVKGILTEQLLVEPRSELPTYSDSSFQKDDVYSQRLIQEGDCIKGNTDIPQQAMASDVANLRTPTALA